LADALALTGVERDDELAELTANLDRGSAAGARAALISAIGGTPGVGKTALAVDWAPAGWPTGPRRPAVRKPARLRPGTADVHIGRIHAGRARSSPEPR
jgi:hypothetical protein